MAAEKRVNYVIPFTYIIVDIIFTMISAANAIQISYPCHQWLYRTTFKLWLTSAFAISPNFGARPAMWEPARVMYCMCSVEPCS